MKIKNINLMYRQYQRITHHLSLFLASTLFSGSVFAVDLLDNYQEALQNDPVYAGARATFNAGQEKLPQGRALLLPNINISGSNFLANTDYRSGDQLFDHVRNLRINKKPKLTMIWRLLKY